MELRFVLGGGYLEDDVNGLQQYTDGVTNREQLNHYTHPILVTKA